MIKQHINILKNYKIFFYILIFFNSSFLKLNAKNHNLNFNALTLAPKSITQSDTTSILAPEKIIFSGTIKDNQTLLNILNTDSTFKEYMKEKGFDLKFTIISPPKSKTAIYFPSVIVSIFPVAGSALHQIIQTVVEKISSYDFDISDLPPDMIRTMKMQKQKELASDHTDIPINAIGHISIDLISENTVNTTPVIWDVQPSKGIRLLSDPKKFQKLKQDFQKLPQYHWKKIITIKIAELLLSKGYQKVFSRSAIQVKNDDKFSRSLNPDLPNNSRIKTIINPIDVKYYYKLVFNNMFWMKEKIMSYKIINIDRKTRNNSAINETSILHEFSDIRKMLSERNITDCEIEEKIINPQKGIKKMFIVFGKFSDSVIASWELTKFMKLISQRNIHYPKKLDTSELIKKLRQDVVHPYSLIKNMPNQNSA